MTDNKAAIIHIANLLIEAVEALGAIIDQPDQEVFDKEAQRIEKPMEERSVPGVIILKK